MKKILLLALSVIFLLSSCSKEEEYVNINGGVNGNTFTSQIDLDLVNVIEQFSSLNNLKLPEDGSYSSIPQDPRNIITQDKVELGKLLVHDNATAANPRINTNVFKYACASCHPVGSSFFSGSKQGIGEGGIGFGFAGEARTIDTSMPLDSVDILSIKVPTLLNLAYQNVMLSSGSLGGAGINSQYINLGDNPIDFQDNLLGYQGLETQGMSGQPAHGLLAFSKFLENFPQYKEYFDRAFPDLPPLERYSRESGGLAIAAYVRTLLANQAPWQKWLQGESEAMNNQEKRGATLFMSKGKCYECHNGPALSSDSFYSFGLANMRESGGVINDEEDFQEREKGRGDFTKNSNDDYKFKVPTLYNLRDAKFYGHGSSFSSIRDIIAYKNNGVKQNRDVPNSQLASQFGTTNLTDDEIDDITAFLTNALYDPNLQRYVPNEVLSGYCFPANDAQSKIDLGCN